MANWVDWAILGVIAVSCLIGVWRGLLKELMTIVIAILAVVTALVFYDKLALLWIDELSSPGLRNVAAFGVIMIAVMIVGGLLSFIAGKLFGLAALKPVDRILGLLFGLFRGCVIVMAVLLMLPNDMVETNPWWTESTLIPHFLVFEDQARMSADRLVLWAHQFLQYV